MRSPSRRTQHTINEEVTLKAKTIRTVHEEVIVKAKVAHAVNRVCKVDGSEEVKIGIMEQQDTVEENVQTVCS